MYFFYLFFILLFLPLKTKCNFDSKDDQGYGDVNAHGHPYLKTPNINKFKSQSVSFENFYVSPSCSLWAALLTGAHEFKNGVVIN